MVDKFGKLLPVMFEMHARRGSRRIRKPCTRTVCVARADWAFFKSAPAVGADIVQHVLGAVDTEGAFVTAYHDVGRIRGEIRIAIFAIWPQLQHAPRADLDQLAHGNRGVGHAAGKSPFIVVPGQDAAHDAVHDLRLIHVEDGRMGVVVEIH